MALRRLWIYGSVCGVLRTLSLAEVQCSESMLEMDIMPNTYIPLCIGIARIAMS